MQLDADEGSDMGQKVSDTFALVDYFLGINESPERLAKLLFGDQREGPSFAEYAMYTAYATSARSLSPGRKVGAALTRDKSIVATGFNDVPEAEDPDVATGVDASETYKRQLVEDTLRRIQPMLEQQPRQPSGERLARALDLLRGSEFLSVIEGQRAVHAEASAIGDAAKRGLSIARADLYCITYPCHLCFKTVVDADIQRIFYVEPYPKSRAEVMYPKSVGRLLPYEGVAPRRFMSIFRDRPVPRAGEDGRFPAGDVRHGRLPMAPENHADLITVNEGIELAKGLIGVADDQLR